MYLKNIKIKVYIILFIACLMLGFVSFVDVRKALATDTFIYYSDDNSGTNWGVRTEYFGRGIHIGPVTRWSDGPDSITIRDYAGTARDKVSWYTSCVDPTVNVEPKYQFIAPGIDAVYDTIDVTCKQGRAGIYKACDKPNNQGNVNYNEICPGTPDCATNGRFDACNKGSNFCGSGGNACDRLERYCNFSNSVGNWCDTRVSDNNNANCAENNNRCFNDNQCGRNQICTGNNGSCGSCVTVCSISGVVYVDEQPNGRLDDNDRRMNNEEVQLTNFSPNRTTRTNSNGVYTFNNITQGSQHDVRLINPDSGRFRIEGNNPRNNQTCSDDPNFRLTRREYSINGTVWVDNNGQGGLQTGGNNPDGKYRRAATVTAGGKTDKTGTNPPNVGDFTINGFINGDYNVRLSDVAANYTIVTNNNLSNPREATINDGNANNVNFLVRQDTPDTDFTINGTIYVNTNGQAGLQTAASGGVPADTRLKNYLGGNTNPNLIVSASNGTVTRTSGALNANSQFSVPNLSNGTYTVTVTNSSYTVQNPANARHPRTGVVINNDDENNINFLLAPPSGNSISGGVFLDKDSDGIKDDSSEPYTTGAADSPQISVTSGSQSNANSGQFNLTGIPGGSQTVTVGNPPAGFRLTWPTASNSFTVTTGAGCTPNANDHWDCSGNNVTNLNIGIEADTQVDRWIQAEGGDIRADNGLNNIVPAPNYLSKSSATMTFGVVIGQGINIGGASRANEKSWLINNSTFKSNTIRTSYAQVVSNLKKGGVWKDAKPMFADNTRPCEGPSQADGKCELKANITPGIYKSARNVTLQNPPDSDYVFGAGDYIFVIDGSLRIETNITVPAGSTVMFVSNENITVANDITNIAGVFSADGNFTVQNPTGGGQGSQLQIQGSVIANAGLKNRQSGVAGAFINNRDLLDENFTTPSVLFTYRPDFILNAPEIFKYSTYKIQEIAPQSIEGAARGGGNPGGGGGGDVEEQCTETNAEFCARVGNNATCGSVSGTDLCGNQRTVPSCGTCTVAGQTCGGGGTPNKCGTACIETNAEFCERKGNKNCGEVSGLDKCGNQRTVPSCGICTVAGQTCGGGGVANVCGAACTETNAQFCARVGKNCGDVTGTSCGVTKTINCGASCPTGQTCGARTPNVCAAPPPIEEEDKFTFYCQYGAVNANGKLTDRDSWNYTYDGGKYCNIAGSGCAMTSLAMIMKNFGDNMNPTNTSKQATNNKYSTNLGCQSPGTLTSQIEDTVRPWINEQGYSMNHYNLVEWTSLSGGGYRGRLGDSNNKANLRHLKQTYINNGFLLQAGAVIRYATRTGLSAPSGHAFVITDIDVENETMTIYDPTFCQTNNDSLSGGKRIIKNLDSISGNPIGCSGSGDGRRCGWVQLFAVKKRNN